MRKSRSPSLAPADSATASNTSPSTPSPNGRATAAPCADQPRPTDNESRTSRETCAARSLPYRDSLARRTSSDNLENQASDWFPRLGTQGCKPCPPSLSTPSDSSPASLESEPRALCMPSVSTHDRPCG